MSTRKAKIEKYEAKDGFRWRLRAPNGRIIADSAEAYSRSSGLDRAVESVCNSFRIGIIEVTMK